MDIQSLHLSDRMRVDRGLCIKLRPQVTSNNGGHKADNYTSAITAKCERG